MTLLWQNHLNLNDVNDEIIGLTVGGGAMCCPTCRGLEAFPTPFSIAVHPLF